MSCGFIERADVGDAWPLVLGTRLPAFRRVVVYGRPVALWPNARVVLFVGLTLGVTSVSQLPDNSPGEPLRTPAGLSGPNVQFNQHESATQATHPRTPKYRRGRLEVAL